MYHTLRQQLLEQIIAIIERARPLLEAIRRKDRELASQLGRALNSIALNVAEGFGSQAGNARLRFQCAHGSLYEAQAAPQLAAAWGHIDGQRSARVVQALDALGARLFGLSRR